jgi:hypothetical protein
MAGWWGRGEMHVEVTCTSIHSCFSLPHMHTQYHEDLQFTKVFFIWNEYYTSTVNILAIMLKWSRALLLWLFSAQLASLGELWLGPQKCCCMPWGTLNYVVASTPCLVVFQAKKSVPIPPSLILSASIQPPLPPPTNIKVERLSVSFTEANISWTAPTGAHVSEAIGGYRVMYIKHIKQVNDNKEVEMIDFVGETSAIMTGKRGLEKDGYSCFSRNDLALGTCPNYLASL